MDDFYCSCKVNKKGPFPENKSHLGRCWLWKKSLSLGYGTVQVKGKNIKAHRMSYQITHGKIPEGFVIDHLCRNRNCVRPNHLEAVTNKENILRGENTAAIFARRTHCQNGHEFTKQNTHIRPDGARQCRICRYKDFKAWKEDHDLKISPSASITI